MTQQLRVYSIKAGSMEDWSALFLRTTLPMRRAAGFGLDAWVDADGNRFFWLLSREGSRDEFLAADAEYNTAPEHGSVLAEARAYVEKVESFFVDAV